MRKLLIATDMSPYASAALSRGLFMAAAGGAAVRVVHVPDESVDEAGRAAARQRIDQWCRSEAPAVAVEVELRAGPPAEGILRAAVAFGPDLIVVGAHTRMRLRDAWLGTTAAHVLRRASAPVLVVRSPVIRPYQRLLAALDDSAAAETVLRLAGILPTVTEIHAVHAFGMPNDTYPAGTMPYEEVDVDEQQGVEAIVHNVARAFPGVRFETIVEPGDAIAVVRSAVERVSPDLLLFGTEGRGGLSRLLLGSVAESALAYFELDMLVVRTGEGEAVTG